MDKAGGNKDVRAVLSETTGETYSQRILPDIARTVINEKDGVADNILAPMAETTSNYSQPSLITLADLLSQHSSADRIAAWSLDNKSYYDFMGVNVTTDRISYDFSGMRTYNNAIYTTSQPIYQTAADFPFSIKVTLVCILSLVILCAICGNVLVCVAIFTERSLRKTSNFFYVSLALADLLVAVVVMTFALSNDMMGHWIFTPIFCDIWLSADVMCSTASILNMCAICLDRFLHIRNPYHYESTMTTKRTLLFIAIIWLLSALISFLPIHLDLHKTDNYNPYEGDKFICLLELNPVYALASSGVSFFIPCVIMIIIYLTLYGYARRHVAQIKRTSASSAMLDVRLDARVQQSNQYKASDHKAAVTLGVIMGTFLLCWMPFFIMNVTGAFCDCVPPVLFFALTWLGYINSVANPIIYPVFNKDFRVAFRRILSGLACCNNKRCKHHNHMVANTLGIDKQSRSPSTSSSLFNKIHSKLTHLNGHSFGTEATLVSDKSDYTLHSQRSVSANDAINIVLSQPDIMDCQHPLITGPAVADLPCITDSVTVV